MKITLRGKEYEVGDLTHDAPIKYVLDLKKITKDVTMKSIREELPRGLNDLRKNGEASGNVDIAELFDDEKFIRNFQAMIWLAGRTYAHIDWTWDEAGEATTLGMLFDATDESDEDEADEADPKASGESEDDEPPAV